MTFRHRFAPCLWFDRQAEAAVQFYTGIFPNSRITATTRCTEAGKEHHGMPPGTVMFLDFELDGCPFTALNGGPTFKFSEAISLQIFCQDQAEIDYYWAKLTVGGDPQAQVCGWLKDQYGLSWQVVPSALHAYLQDPDAAKFERVMAAIHTMKKLDLAALTAAYEG